MSPVHKPIHALVVALTLLAGVACGPPPEESKAALTIDGEGIEYPIFDEFLKLQVGDEDLGLDDAVKARLFDQFIDGQLIIRLAVERGLVPPRDELPTQREAMAFLVGEYQERGPSDAEVARYYAAHPDEFKHPSEVHLRQILVHDRGKAEEAHELLGQGVNFAEVAARFSQGPRAHAGGDQGRLSQDDLPPAFVDAIFGLSPGEASPVIAADYGYHIFQVLNRYPEEVLTLDDAAHEIRQRLLQREIDDMVEKFFAEARERYTVVIVPANLPFNYKGSYAHDDASP